MHLSLKELVTTPDRMWFSASKDEDGIVRFEPGRDESSPCQVELSYISQDEFSRALVAAQKRKAVTKGGKKAKDLDEIGFRTLLCKRCVHTWKMTFRGLEMIQAEIDFSKIDDFDAEVPFTDENLSLMAAHSQLGTFVNTLAQDYELWFGADAPSEAEAKEEQAGNSASGSGSSTSEPPAGTA